MNISSSHPGLILLILLVLCSSGCLPAEKSDVSSLLGQDYLRMADSELVAYEQKLSDELVRSSRDGNGDVNVGIGFGSFGSNVGYGVTVDKWLGGSARNEPALELRDRRDEVRTEMRRRGLLAE